MLVEILCFAGIIAFGILLIKEKDLTYVIGFVLGFLMALWVEPRGVFSNIWVWKNIAKPFSYPLFDVPIGVYIIYASGATLVVFLTKCLTKLREEHNDKLDEPVKYASMATGIIFLLMTIMFGVHIYIGLTFIMFGLYLFVRNPVIFYVGTIGLAADFLIEHLFMANMQISYTSSFGDTSIGFFLGGAIISAIILLIGKHLSRQKHFMTYVSKNARYYSDDVNF